MISRASAFIFCRRPFLHRPDLGIVLQQAAVNTVLAAGMTFVILTGGIDLSVGSILAAAAMAGLIVSKFPDLGRSGCRPRYSQASLSVSSMVP